MPSKQKISQSAGRFQAKYGRSVRAKLVKVESKQKQKQKCPYCNKLGVKRLSSGIWKCSKCRKKFAASAYYLE